MYTPRQRWFSPRKFLRLAERLISDNSYDGPCRIRTSIGRAYYAAFLYSKERLERLGKTFPDDHKVHRVVIDELMDRNRLIGSQLESLYQNRIDADYYMHKDIPANLGNHCIGISESIINTVDNLR